MTRESLISRKAKSDRAFFFFTLRNLLGSLLSILFVGYGNESAELVWELFNQGIGQGLIPRTQLTTTVSCL